MPQVIEHIDKIARDKKRDVLFVSFDKDEFTDYHYENYEIRREIIDWLTENKIHFTKCGNIGSEYRWESYRGQLYLDVQIDESDTNYQKIISYFEHPDGTMKLRGVTLFVLQLKIAINNAYHDEPGFWEKHTENFKNSIR